MSKLLGKVSTGRDWCDVYEDEDGRVHFVADADIDADGANGQNKGPVAYKVDDTGSDFLANGGMRRREDGKVVCAHNWARDVAILGPDDEPKVFEGGVVGSKTRYIYPHKKSDQLDAYVDAETVAYVAVPNLVIEKTAGVVIGCKARVTYKGKSIECVVADTSGSKIGEMSIAAARALNINPSPRSGGLAEAVVQYELWPGVAFPGFVLQPV